VRNSFIYVFAFILFFCITSIIKAQNPNLSPQGSPADTAKSKTKKDSIQYGPHTVSYLYEWELYYNRDKISPKILKDTTLKMKALHYADTFIINIHRYNAIQKNNNTFQDLGVYGTATQSIFYIAPKEIGTRLGYNVYDEYLWQPSKVKYYSSFSPYTELNVLLGGIGRSYVNVTLARNIRFNWSIGLVYRRIDANKVFGRNSRRNDAYVTNETYGAYSKYYSLNQRYKMMAHFSVYNHNVNENGGYASQVQALQKDTIRDDLKELLDLNIAQWRYRVNTTGEPIQATQGRTLLRLYHQYALFDSTQQDYLQVFHIGEWTRQKNNYIDSRFRDNLRYTIGNQSIWSGVYPKQLYFDTLALFNPPAINDANVNVVKEPFYKTTFTQLDNHFGIKGKANKFDYRAYFRVRTYQLRHDFIATSQYINPETGQKSSINLPTYEKDTLRNQYFVGGSLHYQFSDSSYLDVEAEYLLAKDFRLKAEFTNKLWTVGHEQVLYSPTLVQQRMYGTFFKWNNDFLNTFSVKTYGNLNIRLPHLLLQPTASFTNISNYVYFDTLIAARQTTENISILQVGLNATAAWKNWRVNTNLWYNKNLGADFIRMPAYFVNLQLYYEKMFFRGALFGQIGTDIHYKSAFYANGYSAPLQQFHLQNRFTTDNYVVADFFFNFKVSRAMLFIKVVNLLQDVIRPGYFNTPIYLAQPRSFEIGINWLFFD
jgi:hypothetical protein